MLHELFATERVRLGTVGEYVARLDELRAAVEPFTPEAVATRCGIDARTIRQLAHDLADAPSAAVYARIGTTVSPFGTVTSWLRSEERRVGKERVSTSRSRGSP